MRSWLSCEGIRAGAASALLLLGLAMPRPAFGRERVAVAILVEGDPDLSDNLTEVAISSLAESREWELVGLRELRAKLHTIAPSTDFGTCLLDPTCLPMLGIASDTTEAVLGRVNEGQDQRVVHLKLTETKTATDEVSVSKSVPEDLTALIELVRTEVPALFARKKAQMTVQTATLPILRTTALDPRPPPLVTLSAPPAPPIPPPSHRGPGWKAYLGGGAAALSIISYSAAVVAGTLAEVTPVGASRAEAQADLSRREGYARTANGLLAIGTVLAGVAGVAFAIGWRTGRDRAR